jgi:hypothetical protein
MVGIAKRELCKEYRGIRVKWKSTENNNKILLGECSILHWEENVPRAHQTLFWNIERKAR